ncbi:MAG: HAD family hydrolase [Dehalococcoidia bacterium]
MPDIRAAIFDIGGVLTSSPVIAIREYAIREGVDYGVLGPMIGDHDLAWSRWERSELTISQFIEQFESEGRDRGITVSAQGIMDAAFGTQSVREEMVAVVKHLRGRVRLGCITNNVAREEVESRPRAIILEDLFEVVIESSKVGLRKPDARIYHMACEALAVTPPESVFLDDIGANLKGARAVGMATIKVNPDHGAIAELEAILGFPLPRP